MLRLRFSIEAKPSRQSAFQVFPATSSQSRLEFAEPTSQLEQLFELSDVSEKGEIGVRAAIAFKSQIHAIQAANDTSKQ